VLVHVELHMRHRHAHGRRRTPPPPARIAAQLAALAEGGVAYNARTFIFTVLTRLSQILV
jgi:hypothetical protein